MPLRESLMEDLINFLKTKRKPKVIVLTGAGVSAESGIKTFRESGGLWENYKIEDVATPEGFYANPELVYEFYNMRRRQAKLCEPNRGHLALAELEELLGHDLLLITQNVDNLHEKAGSRNILHMHGELFKARCFECGTVVDWEEDLNAEDKCESCNGPMRPHIVWFNEMPLFMDDIISSISSCDLFISVGTSGVVYPAAGFYQLASSNGAHTVEMNLNPTGGGFNTVIEGPSTKTVDLILKAFKSIYTN